MPRHQISAATARRIALAAQGFDRPRPGSNPDRRHFSRVVKTLGLLQLDYVNVLMPAQQLVFWSRLGAYDRSRLQHTLYGHGRFTEQWAHEASLIPVETWPLLAYRRQAHEMGRNNPLRRIRSRTAYLDGVLRQVEQDGRLTAADLPPVAGPRRKPGDWHRSIPRWALEFHFARGDLAVADRLPNYQRVYDLPGRVLPATQLQRSVSKLDAQRELLLIAARAMGIATTQDLADYFRMTVREALPRLAELVEEGEISPVRVDGWDAPAFLSAAARVPRCIEGASLLSPFDPVVWFRPRAERLFGFHYRIEIYVPAKQRKWGYYVLPFRVADKIVGRLDLKADRQRRTLCVQTAHCEAGVEPLECARHMAQELCDLADWLELETISVTRHNTLARALAKSL
jgi:uncharacterized protein YcaQ